MLKNTPNVKKQRVSVIKAKNLRFRRFQKLGLCWLGKYLRAKFNEELTIPLIFQYRHFIRTTF